MDPGPSDTGTTNASPSNSNSNSNSPDPDQPARRPQADPFGPDQTSVVWRGVSPRLIAVHLISMALWVLCLSILTVTIWLIAESTATALIGGFLIVIVVVRGATAIRALRAWGYAERETDLLVRHGLFVRRLSIVPYGRMQFIDVTANPVERSFGLATVALHTAAAASDARIPGLTREEATRLRDRLSALGQKQAEYL